ncbi:hypothetical protein B0H14DRAFT_2365126 [Mycena olivaceomarginata]|nr:hypothetical protein B0H14DRAFT_2365126 [Mycena olivaceomarginata]
MVYDSIAYTLVTTAKSSDLALLESVLGLFISVLGADSRHTVDILRLVEHSAPRLAIWILDLTGFNRSPSSGNFIQAKDNKEAIFEPDNRAVVAPHHFKDGGKYRCEFPKGNFIGTGYLVAADEVVTAAHNVYDKEHGGAAIHIECYIGYDGDESFTTGNPEVQRRYGSKVITNTSWISDHNSGDPILYESACRHDVAFILVDTSFTGVLKIFKFTDTPSCGDGARLGVVGYPGDKETGARMYELFESTDYDLDMGLHMISHRISTFKGQSGSPILLKTEGSLETEGSLVVIGTHAYGDELTTNSGSSIGGKWGNDYHAFLSCARRYQPKEFNKIEVIALSSTG